MYRSNAKVRVAYLVDRRHPTRVRTCLLFSTDIEQDQMQIYHYYKLRFQIEFIFRSGQTVYRALRIVKPAMFKS